ncbi:MAG: hypothetical protein FWH32_03030 [Clostridiales bacterium]|nr:hypothetical protein [Clostridiales bacterium]
MVEAAVLFPIAVFCAMAVMALMLNIYSQTATQVHLHVYLRGEAAANGDRSQARLTDEYARDRYRREAESVSFAVSETGSAFRKQLEASRSVTYYGGRFTSAGGYETEYYARNYILDEAAMVRTRGAIAGVLP